MRYTLLIVFLLGSQISLGQDVSAKDVIKSLGIGKKNQVGLEQKIGSKYSSLKDGVVKANDLKRRYDESNDLISVFFTEDGNNYADVTFSVDGDKIQGAHFDVYLSSSTKTHQIMEMLTKKFNKLYDASSNEEWHGHTGGRDLRIEMYDGASNGYVGFVIEFELM